MRGFLVAVVIVALILVAADISGRRLAEHQAADAIATHLVGEPDTDVDIHGFSFLAQAMRGEYSSVTVTADDLRIGPLSDVDVEIELTDVTLPLSAAMSGTVDELAAQSATLTATVPSTTLASTLHHPGLSFSYQTGDTADVSTTIAVQGRTFPVTVEISAQVVDDELTLSASPVTVPDAELPAEALDTLVGDLTATIPLDALPFPLDSASVQFAGDDVLVTASVSQISAVELGLASESTPGS